jgi:translation initiation factor IF-1
VQVTVHGGRATLRNEAGEVALGAGVQASAEEPQPPVVHGVRPSGAMEETLAGRVLEVKGGTLRVQTEEGTVVTARVGAEGQGGVWYRARVGRSLRSLQVGDPVAIKFWSDARDQWLTAVNRRPRPQAAPVEAEEPPALAGEGQVSGQVTSATGQPLAGVEVELQDEGGVLERAITDDRGQFRMAHVPAGTYHLLATAPDGRQGQSADVQVDTNQTVAVPLTLPAAPSRTEPPEERGDTSKGPNGF